MGLRNSQYPNLELIEYKFMEFLNQDLDWKNKFLEVKKENKYCTMSFDAIVFPQIWGNTATAFDLNSDGSPVLAGNAMTKEYTVVLEETVTHTYGIFIRNQLCYIVSNPRPIFFADLKNHSIKSYSEAKKYYRYTL